MNRSTQAGRDQARAIYLDQSHAAEIVAVLAEAFYDYPVMRFVLGADPDYGRRLATLAGLVVQSRIHRNEPMLGVRDVNGTLVGAALVSVVGRKSPDILTTVRDRVWQELGGDAKQRYEQYGAACEPLLPSGRHHHLHMIGVSRFRAGSGLGRVLLEEVARLAEADGESAGVSLSTENPRNVELYRHFGYRVVGEATVAEGLVTWGMMREAGVERTG